MERNIYIENEVIYLADITVDDIKLLYDSWNDYDTILGYNYRLPYTYSEYVDYCKTQNHSWSPVIIKKDNNVTIGRVGLSPDLSVPDLSITIFKPYQEKSYGTQAFMLAIKYCFDVLNMDKIFAGAYEDNVRSIKMIKKCGFIPHPDGNILEKHILTGEDRLQLDFVVYREPIQN